MKTVALRFSDKFAPKEGTINAHDALIRKNGFVWYGKLGLPLSDKVINIILNNESSRILLIHSGRTARYWAYVTEITKSKPDLNFVPSYYREMSKEFNTWFKITRFELAPSDVMSKCIVSSSGAKLGETSKRSMSPYFIIETED